MFYAFNEQIYNIKDYSMKRLVFNLKEGIRIKGFALYKRCFSEIEIFSFFWTKQLRWHWSIMRILN